jgi:polyhydroxyalkanoate synthesis regulator protein
MYDTQTSRSITLSELAELIKQGEEIQVMGHPTGKDLTSITLVQILLGQEKNKKELFSALLRELIKKRGKSSVQELYPTSLFVALNGASFSEEKARETVRELVNKKRVSITEGQKLLESLRTRIQENRKALEREVEDKLRKKIKEVENLYRRQILELRKNVENLRELLAQRRGQRLQKNKFS